jgi:hypothetical protein
MWTFFDHLLDFIKSIPWKTIWLEITKIPKWLRNFMVFSFCLTAFYFMYTKPRINAEVNQMQSEVVSLNKKVSTVISINDYSVDLEYMITALYVLEELNE